MPFVISTRDNRSETPGITLRVSTSLTPSHMSVSSVTWSLTQIKLWPDTRKDIINEMIVDVTFDWNKMIKG